jgi:hypothetical protein
VDQRTSNTKECPFAAIAPVLADSHPAIAATILTFTERMVLVRDFGNCDIIEVVRPMRRVSKLRVNKFDPARRKAKRSPIPAGSKASAGCFTALARGSGWTPLESWTDAAGMFSVHALVASD